MKSEYLWDDMKNDAVQKTFLWSGMPEFEQEKIRPFAQIILRVRSQEDLDELSRRLEQPLTPKTKSAWFPFKSHWGLEKKVWTTNES